MTDKMYPNTRIPRSFELTVSSHKFWVHPNATKHIKEYLIEAINTTHSMPINSQTMLTSMKTAMEEVIAQGVTIDQIVTSGCDVKT